MFSFFFAGSVVVVLLKMPVTASRLALRQSRFLIRRPAIRYNSTTSDGAAKAKDATASTVSKASEGLSKVTSAAGPAIAGAVSGVGGALKRIGGRTGRLVSFVECEDALTLA